MQKMASCAALSVPLLCAASEYQEEGMGRIEGYQEPQSNITGFTRPSKNEDMLIFTFSYSSQPPVQRWASISGTSESDISNMITCTDLDPCHISRLSPSMLAFFLPASPVPKTSRIFLEVRVRGDALLPPSQSSQAIRC